MINFHSVKRVYIRRMALSLTIFCGAAFVAQAESNIDKYRSKDKPLYRRYKDKVQVEKEIPQNNTKAQKRSLPPGTFKNKSIFKGSIKEDIPNPQFVPPAFPTTPFDPDELEPAKPWINSERFKLEIDTRSIYEGDPEEVSDEPEETILDFDNMAEGIINQSIKGTGILEDGILPDDEDLSQTLEESAKENDLWQGLDGEDDELTPLDHRLRRNEDAVTSYRPSLSPSLSASLDRQDESSEGSTTGEESNLPDSFNQEGENLNPEQNAPFESAVEDARMIIGGDSESDSIDSDDNRDEIFSQSQELIDNLTKQHLDSYKSRQEKQKHSAADELIAKYSFKPTDLSYKGVGGRGQEDEDADATSRRTNPLISTARTDERYGMGNRLGLDNTRGSGDDNRGADLLSNPAVSNGELNQANTFRPTGNVDAPNFNPGNLTSLGGSALNSTRLGASTPSRFNTPNFDKPGLSSNASLSGNRFSLPKPGNSGFGNGGLASSRFDTPSRSQGGGLGSFASPANNSDGAPNMMQKSRERNRIRSTLGGTKEAFPFRP